MATKHFLSKIISSFILMTFPVVNLYILTLEKHDMEIESFFFLEIVLDSQELEK